MKQGLGVGWERLVAIRRCLSIQRCRLLLALSAAIVAGYLPVAAQEQHVLALQEAGQASVAIDLGAQTAYVVDLGRYGDGDKVGLHPLTPDGSLAKEGVPLLDALAGRVKHLVFICSHPHADHMGGIVALFKNPRVFFADDAWQVPRFESITVIDNGVTNSLEKILTDALPKGAWQRPQRPVPAAAAAEGRHRLTVGRMSAATRNAAAGLSSLDSSVYVRTIPYKQRTKAGPHGRAVVTLTVLGGKHSILDFDDADTPAIKEVISKLKGMGIESIDTFIVPHHGSRYHDIKPVLALKPTRAIVTVDPENRNGHPAPEILDSLMTALTPENVLFTGSVQNIVLGPEGVISKGNYTAAMRDSFALFVLPNIERAFRKGKKISGKELEAYKRIAKVILERPPGPGDHRAADDLIRAHIGIEGSMLTPEFALAYLKSGGVSPKDLDGHRIFPGGPGRDLPPDSSAIYVAPGLGGSPSPDQGPPPVNRSDAGGRALLAAGGASATGKGTVRVRFETTAGFDDATEPPQTVPSRNLAPRPADSPVSAPPAAPPAGGMVYLTGGKLYAAGSASALLGGIVDLCGESVCIKTVDGGDQAYYTVPGTLDPLSAGVWDKVYRGRIDAFYLSINPTKRFLQEMGTRFDSVPSDKLRFGAGGADTEGATNEVVTAGEIERSRIGRILWEADVLFKSRALGFDVLAGRPETFNPAGLPAGTHESGELDDDLAVEPENRWCRLFWLSGPQRITIDQVAKKILFTGDAVLAQAEAMTLEKGKLTSAPNRQWCEGARAVAKGLQKQANSRTTKEKTLADLREIAQTQNIARWARDNGLPMSVELGGRISELLEVKEDFRVPHWTSGIRSDPGVLVQLERSGTTLLVHVSFSRANTLSACVGPEWERRKADFEQHHIRFNPVSKKWEGSIAYLNQWMSGLATKITTCTGGTLLLPNGVIGADDDESGSQEEAFGIEPHVQPVSYHGGVLLGALRPRSFLEAAWKTDGTLRQPDGHLLFQRSGEDLHFWQAPEAQDGSGSITQHAVIHGGRVVDAYASKGRVRFLVDTQPGSVIRREMRTGPIEGFGQGLEWAVAQLGLDGAVLLEKAAWPCNDAASGASECVEIADMPEARVQERLGSLSESTSGIRVVMIDPSAWLVDVDLAPVRKQLDQKWAALTPSDANAALALARTYSSWGFEEDAQKRSEDFIAQVEGESEDTILSSTIVQSEGAVFLSTIARLLTIDMEFEADNVTPVAAVQRLAALERRVKEMTPDQASIVWESMAKTCDAALERGGAKASGHLQIEKAKARYEGLARRSRALATGSSEPVEHEEDDQGMDDDQGR